MCATLARSGATALLAESDARLPFSLVPSKLSEHARLAEFLRLVRYPFVFFVFGFQLNCLFL